MVKFFTVNTESKTAVHNVTTQVSDQLEGVRDGLAVIYVPHTTASLLICEDDAELREDIVCVAENLLQDCRPFAHIKKNNPNAEAHILSAFSGTSIAIPIADGKLDLGTYQNILLLEMDGPKERKVRVSVLEK
jgi:secondary thiamine-phosphate synthase enzyme